MKALITGITGQIGSYLAELLVDKGHEVHGMIRRTSMDNSYRIHAVKDKVILHEADLTSYASVYELIKTVNPDELYHLAAQSNVGWSFRDPFSTMNINVNGTHYILESIKRLNPACKVYFGASSEMIGGNCKHAQAETTDFAPLSPYAVSKVAGYHLAKLYRKHGMFVACGLVFNSESPRRSVEFVTKKITWTAARIKVGLDDRLQLGNITAQRDWTFAGDTANAIYLMLQHNEPDDFVIASGVSHSVEEFCNVTFSCLNLNYKQYLVIEDACKRPSDVEYLNGDSSKARTVLGWKPTVDFHTLIKIMINDDLTSIKNYYKLYPRK